MEQSIHRTPAENAGAAAELEALMQRIRSSLQQRPADTQATAPPLNGDPAARAEESPSRSALAAALGGQAEFNRLLLEALDSLSQQVAALASFAEHERTRLEARVAHLEEKLRDAPLAAHWPIE